MNPVSIRLLNQQFIGQQFTDPADVVSHLGAIQAQDNRMMGWAVTMRTKNLREKHFAKPIIVLRLSECTYYAVLDN